MPKAGGVFTGVVSGITAASGDSSTALATTAFVQQEIDSIEPGISLGLVVALA
jgi:hypothetical protein